MPKPGGDDILVLLTMILLLQQIAETKRGILADALRESGGKFVTPGPFTWRRIE